MLVRDDEDWNPDSRPLCMAAEGGMGPPGTLGPPREHDLAKWEGAR